MAKKSALLPLSYFSRFSFLNTFSAMVFPLKASHYRHSSFLAPSCSRIAPFILIFALFFSSFFLVLQLIFFGVSISHMIFSPQVSRLSLILESIFTYSLFPLIFLSLYERLLFPALSINYRNKYAAAFLSLERGKKHTGLLIRPRSSVVALVAPC